MAATQGAAVQFDLAQIDHLLSTTRAVRRRLDLTTPVPDDVLLRCIDLAEQAPTGGNQTDRRWIVVRDPALKREIADRYREVGLPFLETLAARERPPGQPDRVFGSALYLARSLERVPALVLVTIHGHHDGSSRPGLYDSVLQSAWSFCLAARARGLGTAWTTLHLNRAEEVAQLLAIPDGVTQVVLFPVAWTTGDDFRPVPRRPAHEITYFDGWGLTRPPAHGGQGDVDSSVRVLAEARIARPRQDLWDVIFSHPAVVPWPSPPPPGGAAHVRTWEPPRTAAWTDPQTAWDWHLHLEPILIPGDPTADATLATLAALPPPGALATEPGDTAADRARLADLRTRLQQTLDAITSLATGPNRAGDT